jgi:UDP-glucose:(heptosyl)LPS alpha-1,3-glucosyltransferase
VTEVELPMHVALVHMRSARVGGTESYLNQVARHLCEHGHDVTIVCRSHEDAPHPKVRFVVLRALVPGSALRILAFARDVERHVRDHAYDLVVGLGRTWSQDVLRVSGGCHATYLALAHESSSHGWARWLDALSPKHRVILSIEAKALASDTLRCVIVNSELVRRDLLQRYRIDPERVRLIRNGVDLARFHPRQRAEGGRKLREELRLGAGPVVLFLGSNYGRKGLGVVLEAFPELRRHFPSAKLVVVGADPDIAGWKRRAHDLGLDDAALFLGKRSDTEACYGASDVYVLPTRYDSFAYTVLEALASGVPAIVSDAAGASEVIDASCGAVLPATAGAAEVAGALRAWAAPARRDAAAVASRLVAEANGAEAAAERTVALFEELVRSSGARGSPAARRASANPPSR